jgi:DNA/RNA-binding domain of Phe-tRNA-synthetase-like protein
VARHEVRFELEGWKLFFADLAVEKDRSDRARERLAEVAVEVRSALSLETLAVHPTVAALRMLFKAAGTDPSRYRPASEALLRRVLKGEDIPAIHPIVDVNNCLSLLLKAPCCVMAEGSFEPPFVFRSGRDGESYESLRGPFRLEGKPLLLDALGPCDAPITGSVRVKVKEDTARATLVAYLPQGVVCEDDASRALESILSDGFVRKVGDTSTSGR